MKTSNLVSGLVLLAFSILLWFWLIPGQIDEGWGEELSPRLMPQICALGIGLLSIVLIVTSLRDDSKDDQKEPVISSSEIISFLTIAGLLGLGIWLFTVAGPLVAALTVIVGIMLMMGVRSILPLMLLPGSLLLGAYLLFYKVLGTAIL